MVAHESAAQKPAGELAVEDLPAHPIGTLAIVALYGAAFLIGWLALYFGSFLARSAPHP